jgi:hypothetical protein
MSVVWSLHSTLGMKIKKGRKLTVARETIRVLRDRLLGRVCGASYPYHCYNATVAGCCPTTGTT